MAFLVTKKEILEIKNIFNQIEMSHYISDNLVSEILQHSSKQLQPVVLILRQIEL